jgi:protein involved in polysaccharide export with SLBB domain
MTTHPFHHHARAQMSARFVAAITLFVLLALGVIGQRVAAQQPAAHTPLNRALPGLQPGDGVRLGFWRERELNGDYFVDETGSVILPLLGRRVVLGIPADRLKRELSQELQTQLVNQTVQVTLLTRVRIVGAVQRPGLYHVDPTMTVGDAVALAGGPTANGRLDRIRLLRDGAVVVSKLSAADPVFAEIRSGDEITLPERSWLSRNGAVALGAAISALGLVLAQAAF